MQGSGEQVWDSPCTRENEANDGCGSNELPLAPVHGSVTYAGTPLPHGKVVFTTQEGTSGPQSVVVIDYAGVLGPYDLGDASIFGGEPDCHNYSSTGKAECLGTFWRHSVMALVHIAYAN